MKCPNCGDEHDVEQSGRFCDHCGMSVIGFASQKSKHDEEEAAAVKKYMCRFCGVPSPPPVCVACGNKLPLPDDGEEWE